MYFQCPGQYMVGTLSMSLQCICSVLAWYTTLCPQCLHSALSSFACFMWGFYAFTLGARMHLSGVYMVITLWFFKHFTQQKTPGYMLSFFEKKTPLWSPCAQWSNCDYIWKENTTLITMYPAITWWSHLKRTQHKNQWVLCERKPWFLSKFCLQCIHSGSEPLIETSFIKYSAM